MKILLINLIIILLIYLWYDSLFTQIKFYINYHKKIKLIKYQFYEKLSHMDKEFEINTLGLHSYDIFTLFHNEAYDYGYNSIKENDKIIFRKMEE